VPCFGDYTVPSGRIAGARACARRHPPPALGRAILTG
jgi:hypothetical protein